MFGLGFTEILVILAALLIFVGPGALPDLAKSIGKGVRELRKASQDLKSAAMEDEHIGSTVREIQSALTGDPTKPAPKPVPKPGAPTAGRTIGRPAATHVAAPAAEPAAPAAAAPVPSPDGPADPKPTDG